MLCDPCSRYDSDLVGWRVDESVNLEAQKLLVSFRVPCSEQIHPSFFYVESTVLSAVQAGILGEKENQKAVYGVQHVASIFEMDGAQRPYFEATQQGKPYNP